MLNTKQKGISTELQCLSAFSKLGICMSIPYGDYARYDFIADINNKLIKIQVKTASPIDEEKSAYQFSCRSTTGNTIQNKSRRYTEEQIDYFATIINEQCCLIPVTETGGNSKTLRVIKPKNSQAKNISFIEDYLLEKQIQKILES